MFIIHSGLLYVTWGSIIPDPFFRLKIKHMHRFGWLAAISDDFLLHDPMNNMGMKKEDVKAIYDNL